MKKKKRILALIFSFIFLFLVGCAEGGEVGDDWDGGDLGDLYGDTPIEMEGVKVLSKPESYDFNAALGDYSVNYYNLFSWNILNYLYEIYGNGAQDVPPNMLEGDNANGSTFGKLTENSDIYYLYDSIRYTIESVDTTYQNDVATTQTITLKYNDWNWSIPADAQGYEVLFKSSKNEDKNIFQENGNQYIYNLTLFDDWTEQTGLSHPNYSKFYAIAKDKLEYNDKENHDYYPSPFYPVDGVETLNYFQDALEYAIYLFVLGYDYTITEDAPLFDFEIEYGQGDKLGHVTEIKVGGWGNEKIDIEDALGRVKKMYQEDGGYVGLTEKNRQQVVDFILDKIIGADAIGSNDGEFEVKRNTITEVDGSDPISTPDTSLKFDRRYSEIVENIVKYACNQVIIGYNANEQDETLKEIKIDTPYPTSIITDYVGNYFGGSYEGDDDANMFGHIERAEYQSIVFYPPSDAFENGNFTLGDIWLAVEYWDGEHETWEAYNADSSVPGDQKRYLEEITITVGLRVFNKSQNKLIVGGEDNIVEIQKTIEFGKYPPEYSNVDDYAEAYEKNVFTFNDTGTGSDVAFGENVSIQSQFNKNIGSGAINPFAIGTGDSLYHKAIVLSGNNSARAYYKLNESRSYGFYGSLNEEMFDGDDGCDFIEIYFDIQKSKGTTGANYNFKVCVTNFLPAETV